MTKNQRLYNQLRQFVDKQKVREYDNEFFAQKSLTYKFLIPYFNKYMNLELVRDKMTEPKAQAHLTDQLYKFSVHNNKDWQKIKKEMCIQTQFGCVKRREQQYGFPKMK